MSTAAGIIIGDEVLSGKVEDENTPFLIQTMKEAGVDLRRIVVIGDVMEEIIREVRFASEAYDYVFTSGGVGPTHDDLTMAAIAAAFDLPLVRDPILDAMVHQYWGPSVTEAALKLADLPRGARLVRSDEAMVPAVALKNIYILPGIPKLFRAKLRDLRVELRGEPKFGRCVLLNADESAIAAHMTRVVAQHPDVQIGSYPRVDDPECTVRVTVEAREEVAVLAAVDRLLALLPPECLVRVQ